ncbi:hypothetical protein Hanom_Chr14g01322641 [Helianthus anomalus]
MVINIWRSLVNLSILPTSLWRFPFSSIFLISFRSFICFVPNLAKMSTSSKLSSSRKGMKSKPKDPMGPDRAIINWKEYEFHQKC